MNNLFVLLLFILSRFSNAQVVQIGECPDVETVTDFEPSKYLGLWYENRKYPAFFELGGKCITAMYTSESDGTIGVENMQKNIITGKYNVINGNATIHGDPKDGKLIVTFPSVPFPAPYWILGTDYNTYAVVWSCADLFSLNAQTVWILTRERKPPQGVINKALLVLEKNNIKTEPLRETNNEDCE